MTTTTETTIEVRTEIVRALELAQEHEQLSREADTDEARAAHLSTMRAYDKAGAEFASGNMPEYVGYGLYYVSSRSTAGTVYRVNIRRASSCNCEAGMKGKSCWHTKAAEIAEETRLALERANAILTAAESRSAAQSIAEAMALADEIADEDEEERFSAVLDHEQAPEPMAEAYAYEPEPLSDGDDEPATDIYPRATLRTFRGDIGI